MTLAAIDWLSISINLLLVVFVIVCLLLILLVLMQRPKQEGLGAAFGGGLTDQVFGARTTNVLQRGTVYLGSLFFVLSLTLSILYVKRNNLPDLGGEKKPAAEDKAAPADNAVPPLPQPDAGKPKSLLEDLEDTKPVAPAPAPEGSAPAGTPATPPAAPTETPSQQ